MPPRWFQARQSGRPGAIAAPTESIPAVASAAGIGLDIPERQSDCTGARPSWYPFQANVCDGELDPEDRDLTPREMTADSDRW